MKPEIRQEFPETKDKIVDTVELVAATEGFGITIRFQDKTALTFAIESYAVALPVYSDWTDGEEKILKQYESVRSKVTTDAGEVRTG